MIRPDALTLASFLDWEEQQDRRWEFDGAKPIAIPVESFCHAAIRHNLISALIVQLDGKNCQPFGNGSKIEVAGSIRYPDAVVACGTVARTALVVANPVVVFEVLDPTTSDTDVWIKNQEYRNTPSIKRYVMVAQDHLGATVFSRAGNEWLARMISADEVLEIPEIGVEIPLADFFDGVTLQP